MPTLDPNDVVRNYPGTRSYIEMLQDLIAMYDKVLKYNGTDAHDLADALFPAVYVATGQLKRKSDQAVNQMIGGNHQ